MPAFLKDALTSIAAWAFGLWQSVVRTYTPVIVGTVLAWLATTLDWLHVDPDQDGLVLLVSAAAIGLWYLLARTLENQTRFPWLAILGGIMLGLPKPPVYDVHPDNAILMGAANTNVPTSQASGASRTQGR